MSEHSSAEVCVDQRRVRIEELLHYVDRGVHRLTNDTWDGGVFEAINKLINRDGRHGGGGINNQQLTITR